MKIKNKIFLQMCTSLYAKCVTNSCPVVIKTEKYLNVSKSPKFVTEIRLVGESLSHADRLMDLARPIVFSRNCVVKAAEVLLPPAHCMK
jgi:hypothetical protein